MSYPWAITWPVVFLCGYTCCPWCSTTKALLRRVIPYLRIWASSRSQVSLWLVRESCSGSCSPLKRTDFDLLIPKGLRNGTVGVSSWCSRFIHSAVFGAAWAPRARTELGWCACTAGCQCLEFPCSCSGSSQMPHVSVSPCVQALSRGCVLSVGVLCRS